MSQNIQPLTFAGFRHYAAIFAVDRELVWQSIAACEPLVVEALGVHVERHLWRGELPVYPVMTTPRKNGGWGHLMPFWFQPQDRPMPFYALNNWGLFALAYAHSFGPSDEAARLVQQVFTVNNVVRVVAGADLQLPFLPTTQGHGSFFRQGMLPFLLSILWLEAETGRAWLRLHQLGAQHFIDASGLAAAKNPLAELTRLEHAIFSRLERNTINSDEAVALFLSPNDDPTETAASSSLLSLYQDMFGAINVGVTALAAYYRDKPLVAWRDWIGRELLMPYRMPDYGVEAIKNLLV